MTISTNLRYGFTAAVLRGQSITAAKNTLPKARVTCFYDYSMVNQTVVIV